MSRASLAAGCGIYSISAFRYQSVTRDARGVPMIYYLGKLYRPFRPVSRRVLERQYMKAIARHDSQHQMPMPGFDGAMNGKIEANETLLRTLAIFLARHADSAVAAEVLNLDKGTVAAWLAHDTRGTYDGRTADVHQYCTNPMCDA
jgi:hypothetical protein